MDENLLFFTQEDARRSIIFVLFLGFDMITALLFCYHFNYFTLKANSRARFFFLVEANLWCRPA